MKKLDAKYIWAMAIFLAALTLRLVYFFQVKANFLGWDTPTIDPLYHDLWARQIASGNIFGSGPFFRAPFYAYFLGLIYAVFGPSLAAAKIIQHLMGAATCSVIFLFTERYFDRKTAILAGIISAFNWVLIYHEDELLLDSLLVLFSVLIIWSLMKASERRSTGEFFVSGILLGLACITRPNYLAFLPVVFIWLLLVFRGEYGRAIKYFLVAALGAALLILPVTIRNAIIGHDAVLIASQGGLNFYIGNNRYADGATAAMPEFGATWQYSDAEYMAKKESGSLGREMKQSQVSSFYYRKGLDFIFSSPGRWLALITKKLYYFWNSFEISNNQDLYFFRRFASVTSILPSIFFVISPLSLIGLAMIFGLERKYAIIPFFIITYMLTVIAFFVNSRFRLPVLPFLIILAAWVFWKGSDWVREKSTGKLLAAAISLAILIPITNIDFTGISHESYAMSYFSLGNIYLKKGLKQKALEEYAEALSLADCVPKAHLNRGAIYFSQGDYKNAEREFELELEKCHISAEAYNNLSVLRRLGGDYAGALTQARMAVAIKPQYLEARVNEILALRGSGNDSVALAAADTLTMFFPDYTPGHYLKGMILIDHGRIDEARREFGIIISGGPSEIVEKYDLSTIYASQAGYGYKPEKIMGLANYQMGIAFVRAGHADSALAYFKKATEIMPDYADAWTNLGLAYDFQKMYREAVLAFKKSTDIEPNDPRTYYNYGLTLGKVGRLEEAAIFFKQALELRPDFAEAQEKLKLTESILSAAGKK